MRRGADRRRRRRRRRRWRQGGAAAADEGKQGVGWQRAGEAAGLRGPGVAVRPAGCEGGGHGGGRRGGRCGGAEAAAEEAPGGVGGQVQVVVGRRRRLGLGGGAAGGGADGGRGRSRRLLRPDRLRRRKRWPVGACGVARRSVAARRCPLGFDWYTVRGGRGASSNLNLGLAVWRSERFGPFFVFSLLFIYLRWFWTSHFHARISAI